MNYVTFACVVESFVYRSASAFYVVQATLAKLCMRATRNSIHRLERDQVYVWYSLCLFCVSCAVKHADGNSRKDVENSVLNLG